MAAIPEIVVTGYRRDSPTGLADFFYEQIYIPTPPPSRRDPDANRTFIPPALPLPIEEIITRAPRPAAPTAAGPGAGLPWIGIAGILGLTVAEILRELSEQNLERTWEWVAAPYRAPPREIPVKREPMPAPSEVIVTVPPFVPGRPGNLVMPEPLPDWIGDIIPDVPPWRIDPFWKVPLEEPPEILEPAVPFFPDFQPLPVGDPWARPLGNPFTTPRESPGLLPQPFSLPGPAPGPFSDPWAQPQPEPQPQPQPRTGSPGVLTFGQPREVAFPDDLLQPQPQPRTGAPTTECPPCEENNDPRDQCFRKLVKEKLYPADDEEYDWVEIDCNTGKEVKRDKDGNIIYGDK